MSPLVGVMLYRELGDGIEIMIFYLNMESEKARTMSLIIGRSSYRMGKWLDWGPGCVHRESPGTIICQRIVKESSNG